MHAFEVYLGPRYKAQMDKQTNEHTVPTNKQTVNVSMYRHTTLRHPVEKLLLLFGRLRPRSSLQASCQAGASTDGMQQAAEKELPTITLAS